MCFGVMTLAIVGEVLPLRVSGEGSGGAIIIT